MRAQRHHLNEISGALVDAAMKVHSVLGPGLLENVYEVCLVHELNKRGFVPRPLQLSRWFPSEHGLAGGGSFV
jgi:PD-(D/E)XK nuclease superfamily